VTDEELGRLRAACAHALTGHKPISVKRALSDLAAATPDALEFDRYGRGGWLEEFEARVAGELGKEAAVFLPSGTLAQLIALRVWCDAAHARTIAFHRRPTWKYTNRALTRCCTICARCRSVPRSG